MECIERLIKGALDLHQHLGPSVIPRELDVVEAVIEAKENGLLGIAVKDHQLPTTAVTDIVRKYFLDSSEFYVFSGIALNNYVGGLNEEALKTAIEMGARMIWMPTVSTENHYIKHSMGGLKFPASKVEPVRRRFVEIVDSDGRVTDDLKRILKIISEYKHLVLCTGHSSALEVDRIIEVAVEYGIRNIIVNHPMYMIDATLEQMQKWSELGAFIEVCACTSDPISKYYHVDIDKTIQLIRAIGPRNIIISSDYGQKGNIRPVEGLKHFLKLLIDKGLKEQEITQMVKDNPKKVMGLQGY